jgi:hypothetical protein
VAHPAALKISAAGQHGDAFATASLGGAAAKSRWYECTAGMMISTELRRRTAHRRLVAPRPVTVTAQWPHGDPGD